MFLPSRVLLVTLLGVAIALPAAPTDSLAKRPTATRVRSHARRKKPAKRSTARPGGRRHGRKARRRARPHKQIHPVLPGDTVGGIAALYGVKVAEVRRWNKLRSNLIRIGQKLVVYPRVPVRARKKMSYVVRRGDTLLKIAKRFKLTVRQVRRLNRLRSNRIRAGQDLVIYALGSHRVAYGVGSHTHGRLVNGEIMPPGPGYVVRNPRESYGTTRTINHLLRCFGKLRRRDRRAPPYVVGDISVKRGGRFSPHKSHQTGLDVDLGYVPKLRSLRRRFFKATSKNLDAARSFRLMKCFIDTGDVEYIFADHGVQRLLYRHARRKLSRRRLAELFQYPRPRRAGVGIIRHSKGHDDHMHVRFRSGRGRLALRR